MTNFAWRYVGWFLGWVLSVAVVLAWHPVSFWIGLLLGVGLSGLGWLIGKGAE